MYSETLKEFHESLGVSANTYLQHYIHEDKFQPKNTQTLILTKLGIYDQSLKRLKIKKVWSNGKVF